MQEVFVVPDTGGQGLLTEIILHMHELEASAKTKKLDSKNQSIWQQVTQTQSLPNANHLRTPDGGPFMCS
jgi:hypothetical protein